MKMYNAITAMVFFGCSMLYSQDIADHALGLRLGDSDGLGAELSYQLAIGQNNRGELNLGWRNRRDYDAFKLTGTYQWVRHLDGGFNWYYGAGGGIGSVDFENSALDNEDGTFIVAAGVLGIEYNFEIPLVISIDTRPEIGLIGYGGFDNAILLDLAVGIRYQFW